MRLIDADRLVQKLEEVYDTINPRLLGGKSVRALILNVKKYCKDKHYKIDPESLKEHGRWLKTNNMWNENEKFCKCSNCNWGCNCDEDLKFKYCPNCGVKMDLGKGEA